MLPSRIIKRSVSIGQHKTSISLEPDFWAVLKEICIQQHKTLGQLVDFIDQKRNHDNLSSAIRLYVLNYFIGKSTSQIQAEIIKNTSAKNDKFRQSYGI